MHRDLICSADQGGHSERQGLLSTRSQKASCLARLSSGAHCRKDNQHKLPSVQLESKASYSSWGIQDSQFSHLDLSHIVTDNFIGIEKCGRCKTSSSFLETSISRFHHPSSQQQRLNCLVPSSAIITSSSNLREIGPVNCEIFCPSIQRTKVGAHVCEALLQFVVVH